MNTYAILILAALLLEWGLGLLADLLNLRALSGEVPSEFREVYDAKTYRRSQEYTRARTRFAMVPSTVQLALLLAFWFLGGFAALDRAVTSLELSAVPTGLLFIGALAALGALVSLPFRYWSTFVLEERFGFNRTTRRTFWIDTLKGALLAAAIAGPLLAAVLLLFERAGELAWLWCWAVTTAAILLFQYIAPTWIFPLFNRFEPLEDGELKQSILEYADRVDFPLSGLFVIDGSRRSSKANAFFTGFGRNKRVALFDTLIEKHEPKELVAVVAHEIGHFKRKHILKGLLLSIAHMGVLFWLLSQVLTLDGLYQAFGIEGRPIYAGFVFFSLIYTPVELVLNFFLQAFSRRNEFEADRYAAETTGAPETMATALLRLSTDSLSNLTPHPFYVAMNHSHPPVLARIAALRGDGTEPGSPPPLPPRSNAAAVKAAEVNLVRYRHRRPSRGTELMLTEQRVAIIGMGTMGSALARGLLGSDAPPAQLRGTVRHDSRLKELRSQFEFEISTDNAAAVRESDVVLLCTKPHRIAPIVADLDCLGALNSNPLFVSIAAGLSITAIERSAEHPMRVVRAMPNTPCLIREGMTVVSPGSHASPEDLEIAEHLFRPLGRVMQLDEEHLDTVTGLAASGPAFVYVMIEALSEGGVMMGLPRNVAVEMAAQMMQGAARMVLETGKHPAALKDEVTTPAGCTISALLALEDGRIRSVLARGVQEAARAAAGLGGGPA